MAEIPVYRRFAARQRILRRLRKLSCRALAEQLTAAGFPATRDMITGQELGRIKTITIDQLVATAKVFGVPVAELVSEERCSTCQDRPPAGFICASCGLEAADG